MNDLLEPLDDGERHSLAAGEGPEVIHYIDGQEARVGDKVLIDNGERTGVVEDVIDSDAKLEQWGVDEPGLMIKSEYYGLLFLPSECLRHEEVRLLSRSRQ